MPRLHCLLELTDEFVDLAFRVTPHFLILAEATDLVIVVESLAASLEKIRRVMNVRLFELLVGCLLISVILLILVLEALALELGLVVVMGLLSLLVVNELVVEVLELFAQICNDLALVVLLARLLEGVAADLEHLQVVAQSVQVAHTVVKRDDHVVSDREHIQILQRVESFQDGDAVLEKGQIFKLAQVIEPFDFLNQIEAEVEPFELRK